MLRSQQFVHGMLILRLVTVIFARPCYDAELVVGRLRNPLALEFLPHNEGANGTKTLLIAEQVGVVRRAEEGSSEISTFLDISDRVLTTDAPFEERGLLGFTLDPQFGKTNPYVYAFYSRNKSLHDSIAGGPFSDAYDHDSIVSRFEAVHVDGVWKAKSTSEMEILKIPQPHRRQNGGQVFFGDDGLLYVTTGDGGDRLNRRFRKNSLLGKILRLDVRGLNLDNNPNIEFRYRIPWANPFVNESDARPEVYAYGFRNPWRCTVDRKSSGGSGQLFCGDIGEPGRNEEDLYIVESGGRYGWLDADNAPCHTLISCKQMASSLPVNDHLPLHTYSREEGQAVVGGIVYRGTKFRNLYGHYIFADYLHGSFHALLQAEGGSDWKVKDFCVEYESKSSTLRAPHVLSIAGNAEGDIYLLTNTATTNKKFTGAVYKLSSRNAEKDYSSASRVSCSLGFLTICIISFSLISLIKEK